MDKKKKACVLGSGISAWSCVAVLARDGWDLEVVGSPSNLPPYMTVSDSTLALLSALPGDGVFCRFRGHRAESLKVYWGCDYYELDEPIWIVNTETFLQSWSQLIQESANGSVIEFNQEVDSALAQRRGRGANSDNWMIETRRVDTTTSVDDDCYYFGERTVVSAVCELQANACRRTAVMVATPEGWVYMVPTGQGTALIQAVLPVAANENELKPALQALLAESKEVKNRIGRYMGRLHSSSAAPYLAGSLLARRSVALGPAAFGVDPISGDCAGLHVKSAILGATLIQAVESGEDPAKCVDYYRDRLRSDMSGHLKACSTLYDSQVLSPSWDKEIMATRDGMEWLDAILQRRVATQIRLPGKHLESR